MEKGQVTFAVQASGLTGPVGSPLLLVSAALQAPQQQLVIYRSAQGVMFERHRYAVSDGPLHNVVMHEIQSLIDAETYTALMYVKGLQAEFEGLP